MLLQTARLLSIPVRKNLFGFKSNVWNCFQARAFTSSRYKLKAVHCSSLQFCSGHPPPKCWRCEYPHKSDLFCSKCKALQKLPQDLNYFEIIGVERDFDVNVEDVQKKYRHLQMLLHPDKFEQKSEKERKISENTSSLVNKAYNTLTHPLERGIYMLKLLNVSIPEETTSLNAEFLMEIMEKNEQVEEASGCREKALQLLMGNRCIMSSLTKEISEAFRNKDIQKARELLIKMKYFISIDGRLKELKEELGIVE